MSKSQTNQLGRFDDELETFTNKVIRIEKSARHLPRYVDEKNDCFSINTDKTTIPADNGFIAESVFTRVRTRKCLPFKHVATDINTSRPSIDDSFGQICVERVYFAENRDKANVENSQESLQHTLSNPYKTQTGNTNGLCFETPKVNQKLSSNGLSMIARPDTIMKKSRPMRSDAQLFAKRNRRNIPDYAFDGLKSNKSRNVDVSPDAGGKRCVHTAERNISRVINSSATAALCYKQRPEIRQQAEKSMDTPFIQNFNIFSQSHKNRATFTSTLSEGREGLTRCYIDERAVQPIETQPNYFKPNFTNVQKMLSPMAQNQVNGGANHVMKDYFAFQQGIDSRFNSRTPVVAFHSDNDQSTCSTERVTEQDRQNVPSRMMQHWLQTDQTHRQQRRTEQFNQNESQSGTSENAANNIIKPVAKRQRTERSNLHSRQITGNPSKRKLTIQRNNNKYSSSYSSPSFVMKTDGSNFKGKFTESGASESERTYPSRNSLQSNKQVISINRSSELNSAAFHQPLHISQNVQARAYSDSVIGLQNQFVSQRTGRIEMNMQKHCFETLVKKEANVQATLMRQPLEMHSKATQKITRATEASLEISSTKKPTPSAVHQETSNVSKPIFFIQDANKNDSIMAHNNQPCDYRKRKADNENDETVIKHRKSIRQKNGSNSFEDFLTCSNQDVVSATNKFPKNPAFDLQSIPGPTSYSHASLEEKTNRNTNTKKQDNQRPLFKTTVTTNAFVGNPSNKTASITSGGLKTFSAEMNDSMNGFKILSERRGREEREKLKIVCSAFSKAQRDNVAGLKTHSDGIDCAASVINPSKQKHFKNVFFSLHDQKQSSANVEQCKSLCSNSTATENRVCFVHSVNQYEAKRDENCFTNHQTLEAKNGNYTRNEGVIHKPFSCNNQLGNKRNNSEKFSHQLCKEKNILPNLVSKDAATMTPPEHKNRSCKIKRLKVKDCRSKASQTVFYHNCSPQRKTLISKSVEAKLRLPLKRRPQRVSVSCQASVELAPATNVWRQICVPNNVYRHSIPKPNADYLETFPPYSSSSYNHSNSVYGRSSRTLEYGQQTMEEHYSKHLERGLYPTEARGPELGVEQQGELNTVDTKENQQYQEDARVSRNSLPIRKRLLSDWRK